jgi:hypothetical protein
MVIFHRQRHGFYRQVRPAPQSYGETIPIVDRRGKNAEGFGPQKMGSFDLAKSQNNVKTREKRGELNRFSGGFKPIKVDCCVVFQEPR